MTFINKPMHKGASGNKHGRLKVGGKRRKGRRGPGGGGARGGGSPFGR